MWFDRETDFGGKIEGTVAAGDIHEFVLANK
jgi:hypothetical protein